MAVIIGNGQAPTIKSLYGDITIAGTINGNAQGFGPGEGPGSNSTLVNNLGFQIKGYGATHAGVGEMIPDPGFEGLIIEIFTIAGSDIDNGYVRLIGMPSSPSEVAVNIIHGGPQEYLTDFFLVNNVLYWTGNLLQNIAQGDELRVIYLGDTEEIVPGPRPPYGSYEGSLSFGSGGFATSGGSGVKLEARNGTVTVDGLITMNGESGGAGIDTGGAAGGSIWLEAWEVAGTGSLLAEGGSTQETYAGAGGGGYVTIGYEKVYSFSGTYSVYGEDDGIFFLHQIRPILEDKFTGQIFNTKWWQTIEEPVTINNDLLFDSSQNDFRQPEIESLFSISGKNITADVDYIPVDSTEINFYSANFLLYHDAQNWVGIARKHGYYFGVYAADGITGQTATSFDNTDLTFRISKRDTTFSFQYYDSSSTPQTFFSDTFDNLANLRYNIRFSLEKPNDPDGTTFTTEYFGLSGTDASNDYITLSAPPNDESAVALNILGGSSQVYGTDFYVSGQQLKWDGMALDGTLAKNDILRVQYEVDTSINDISVKFDHFRVFDGVIYDAYTTEPVIYVDSTYGSDSNDGRQLNPLQNLFVAAAWSRPGGTIVLYDGTHNPTEVTKTLTIRGANGADALITSANVQDTTGSDWETNALSFNSCQGRVHNLKIRNSETGIYAFNTRNLEVFQCDIGDTSTALKYRVYNRDPVVHGNTLHSNVIGADFSCTLSSYYNSNVAYDSSVAVLITDSTAAVVTSSTIDDCTTAIAFDSSSYGIVASNNITNCTNGIYISSDSTPVDSTTNNFYGTTNQFVGTPNSTIDDTSVDPLYVNASSRDYHLSSGSPNIDLGTGAHDRFYRDRDKLNRALAGTTDIGAYEFNDGTHVGDYYVAGAGDDYVNFGNISDPYRTLDKAMSVADSTVEIDGGHYDSYYLSLRSQDIRLDKLSVYSEIYENLITYITLTEKDAQNKFVQVPGYVFGDTSNTILNIVGGPSQVLGKDYSVGKWALFWDGLDLDGLLAAGDTLRVMADLTGKPLNTFTLHSHYNDIDIGQTLFVSPNGSDRTTITGDGTHGYGNGTLAHPYRSINKALSDSCTGDNIVVFAGDYDLFSGLDNRVISPAIDRTSIIDKYDRDYVQDLFNPIDFRHNNHVEAGPYLWDTTFNGDSTVSVRGGFMSLTYDGSNEARADSKFTIAGDFYLTAKIRNAVDPVTLSLHESDSTISLQYNDGTYVATYVAGGNTYICNGNIDVDAPVQDQLIIEHITLTADETRNNYANLSYLAYDCSNVALNIVGGTPQEYGIDYIVQGNRIIWDGYDLESELSPGEVLRAIYSADGVPDPIFIRLSVENNMMQMKFYNYSEWVSIMKRTVPSGVDGTYQVSFYMDEISSGQEHLCQYGKGWMSQFLAVADDVQGPGSNPFRVKTDRRSIIVHDEIDLPGAPYLVYPPNDSSDTTTAPELYWSYIREADYHRLQVSESLGFSPTVFDQTVTGTSHIVTGLSTDSTYYWRANSGNDDGTSAWSGIRRFYT